MGRIIGGAGDEAGLLVLSWKTLDRRIRAESGGWGNRLVKKL